MTTATLFYRQHNLLPYARTTRSDIEAVATAFRSQLGLGSRLDVRAADLARVDALQVNSVSFEIWSDLTRTIFDESGTKVPGIFEFLPEIEDDAVNVRVSPADESYTTETVLSTFAHELGHAVFEGPALIASRAARRSLGCTEAVSAYRVIEGEAARSAALQSAEALRAEWRANQFMGCLLVPRAELLQTVVQIAERHDFVVDDAHMILEGPGAGIPRMECVQEDYLGHLGDLIVDLAERFGVTPHFVRKRLWHYGLIDEELARCIPRSG